MNENRIEDLEIRMTHLEDYVKQLNEVVLVNSRLLEALKAEQTAIRSRIEELADQGPGPESRRPPHY